MLRYIFITSLFVVSLTVLAQDYTQSSKEREEQQKLDGEGTPKQKKEKIPYPNKKRGTEFGIDISRYLVPVFNSDRFAVEANMRTNFGKRTFIAGSIGSESVSFDDKSYVYESTGAYIRAGIDYDIFVVDEEGNNDNILVGLRYAVAVQEHGSDKVTITDGYWNTDMNPYTFDVPNYTLSTHWVEAVFGLRSEVLKNFYMSWFIRVKGKIATSNDKSLGPYTIPGYGYGSNAVNLGFSYILAYQIPWGNKRWAKKNKSRSLSTDF